MEIHQQKLSTERYLPLPVNPSRVEPMPQEVATLTYPQYLSSVRSQISYLKEIHDLLLTASQNVRSNE